MPPPLSGTDIRSLEIPAVMTTPAFISAVSELPPGRYPDCSGLGLARNTLRHLFDEWPGLRPRHIEGLFVCPPGMASGEAASLFAHEVLFEELGIQPKVAETVNVGGATYSVMVQRAAALIAAGHVESVLCLGAGKFPKVGDGGGEQMARMVSHPQFEFIYGAYIPALYAQAASAHMARYGTSEEQLARVAVSARQWALTNPKALMRERGALTVDAVMGSRPISSPFKLLDCSVPCEGGAAILVTSRAMARDIVDRPARVLGYGERHGFGHVSQAEDLTTLGARDSGRQAYEMAGVQPGDIAHAQLYDAFSINPVILLEDLGFCRAGEGGPFVEAGHCDPGGKLPLNTYGGLMSFGHTGDASGMSMIVEGAIQVMGLAGERQLPGNLTLVHTYGGMMCEHATLILGSE